MKCTISITYVYEHLLQQVFICSDRSVENCWRKKRCRRESRWSNGRVFARERDAHPKLFPTPREVINQRKQCLYISCISIFLWRLGCL